MSNDIINNPIIAHTFAQDPQAFLEAYDMTDLHLNLDDNLLQLIIALGDEEITSAIKNRDIKGYLSLCKKKGLFDNISLAKDTSPLFISLEKSKNFTKLQSISENDSTNSSFTAFAIAAVVGVAAIVWAVTITHVGLANVTLLATAIYETIAINTSFMSSGEESNISQVRQISNSNILKIWNIKKEDSDNSLYIVAEEYKNQITEECIKAIKEVFPLIYEKYGETFLRNNILINIK